MARSERGPGTWQDICLHGDKKKLFLCGPQCQHIYDISYLRMARVARSLSLTPLDWIRRSISFSLPLVRRRRLAHKRPHGDASIPPNLLSSHLLNLHLFIAALPVPIGMPIYQLQAPRGYTVSHSRSSSHGRGHSGHYYPDHQSSDRDHHSGTRYYNTSSRYPTSSGGRYHDSGSRLRHNSISHSGEYYVSPSYSHSHSRQSQPVHHSHSTHRLSRSPNVHNRSHSRSPQMADSGRHHHTTPRYNVVDAGHHQSHYYPHDQHTHRRHSESSSWLGEQFRRLFGGGSHRQRSRSRTRGTSEFTDTRTGRSVDRKGRPIYQV